MEIVRRVKPLLAGSKVEDMAISGEPLQIRFRGEALAELRLEMTLALPDKKLVFGEGPPDSALALVGEAPGREEESTGRPFIGRAGKLLDRLLHDAEIRRDDVWITNIVKWRPTRGKANRTPTPPEILEGLPWLRRELEIVRPKVIVCLGNSAAGALIGKDFKLGRERGQWHTDRTGAFVSATYHPAYLLRQPEDMRRLVIEDLKAALAKSLDRQRID